MRFCLDETRRFPRCPSLSWVFWILRCLPVQRNSHLQLEGEEVPALLANPFNTKATPPWEGGGGGKTRGWEGGECVLRREAPPLLT